MAKKSYYQEIKTLSETWDAVSESPFLVEEIERDWFVGNAVCIGSGGAYCIAKLWEMIHQNTRLGLAQTITPFEFLHKRVNPDLVVLVSASGKNHDILQTFKVALSRNINVLVFTASEKSALVRLALSNPLKAKAIFPKVNIPKDGFLAVNSTIAISCLMLQLERHLLGEGRKLPSPVQDALTDHAKSNAPVENILGKTVQIICAEWGVAAGFDLEARFAESGLAPCFLTDPRNFAHGRFIWLEKWGANSTLVFFYSNATEVYIKKFIKTIPSEINIITVCHKYGGSTGAIYCLTRSMLMFAEFARSCKTDPGMPFVPDWGKKLHRLKYTSKEIDHKNSSYSNSMNASKMPAFQIPFEGIVLDFDGTVVDTLKRTNPVSQEIILEFERLLKDGIKLGVATGRGKSAYNILKEQVRQEFHKNLFVGLYNGTLINCLGDDLIVPTQRWNLKNILDHLITEAQIEPASVFSRNTQISVRGLSKAKKEALTNFLKMRLGVDAKYVKFCVSAHSLDILPHWASKIALVQELSTSTTTRLLCIGDQGQIGGNDEELLMRQPAICVGDKQPASNDCFWLGKNERYRESSGTIKILKSIVKEKELFRLSMFDFGE